MYQESIQGVREYARRFSVDIDDISMCIRLIFPTLTSNTLSILQFLMYLNNLEGPSIHISLSLIPNPTIILPLIQLIVPMHTEYLQQFNRKQGPQKVKLENNNKIKGKGNPMFRWLCQFLENYHCNSILISGMQSKFRVNHDCPP